MAEQELPSDSSIIAGLYPEDAKRIAQIEQLRGVRRGTPGGLLRDQPRAASEATPFFPRNTERSTGPRPGRLADFTGATGGSQQLTGMPGPGAMAPGMVPGVGMVGAPPDTGAMMRNLPQSPPAASRSGGLPRAAGRAPVNEDAGAPGGNFRHEPVPEGQESYNTPPAAAQIDPNSPTEIYRQADEIRKRAYGLAPDPAVIAEEKRKAGQNWFMGTMLQAVGGDAFGPSGGAVLTQALKRKSELETDPEKEIARKVRSLEMEAQALERRAALTQNAQDKKEAEDKRIEQRQWEEKQHNLNRLTQIQAAAAARPHQEKVVAVHDPNDESKIILVPQSTAVSAGMTPAKVGGKQGGLSNEQQRMMVGLGTAERSLNEYEQLLKNYGARSFDQLNSVERAKISSVYARILMEGKEMFQLGALAKEDLQAMEKILTNPTGWRGVAYGNKGLSAQIDSLRRHLAIRREEVNKAGGPQQPGGAPTAPAQSTEGFRIVR